MSTEEEYLKLDAEDLTEEMLDSSTPAEMRAWWVRKTEPGFQKLIEETRAEILRDLRSPAFRREILATAREFEVKVFEVLQSKAA